MGPVASRSEGMAQEKIRVNIPGELVSEILLRLPARSLGKCRCLSKSWLSITSDTAFVRAHAQRSRINRRHLSAIMKDMARPTKFCLDFAPFALPTENCIISECSLLIASCDGLVCVCNFSGCKNQHYVINPLTGHSILLPIDDGFAKLGLYFHRSTSKYRLIRFTGNVVKVLVLGESSWRRIPGNPPAFFHRPRPLDLNGNMYWLASSQRKLPSIDTIVIFDEEQEVYNVISLPPQQLHHDLECSLIDFNGGLGLLVVSNKDKIIDVWIIEDQENLSSWIKRYSVNFADHIHGRCPSQLTAWWGLIGAVVIIGDDDEDELLINLRSACGEHKCEAPHYFIRCNLKSGACVVQNLMVYHSLSTSILPYTETLTNPQHY